MQKKLSIQENNGLSVIDLFCGCGGLSLGFKRQGFNIVSGVDFDDASVTTYNHNFGVGHKLDLSDDKWVEEVASSTKKRSVDVLIGGPPCQGYSLTGTRDYSDSRNKLYNSMFVGAKFFDAKVVLIENVRGMSSLYGGKAKEEVIGLFEGLGYNVKNRILDSAYFYVPQHRQRLFFVATKPGVSFEWPEYITTEDNFVTCSDGIGDLPSMQNNMLDDEAEYMSEPACDFQALMRENSDRIFNHQPTRHKDFVIETIRQVPEGGNHKDLPPGVGESRKFNEAWTRYHSQKPSRTIDTGHRNHFHYRYDRVPTVRENARLQSFPDDFVFKGSKTQQNKQVGNAVPVLLAQALAAEIQKGLLNERP